MTKRSFWAAGGAVLSLVFLTLAILQAFLSEQEKKVRPGSSADQLIYLPSPQQAKLMSLGFRQLMADYYWVKALQYFTDPELAQKQYRNLADILGVVIGVDPDFEYAYKFAGIATPYDSGRLNFKNTERSTHFLELGAARFPHNWQIHFFLGYNYLNFQNRPIEAAQQFAAASQIPGSPDYLKTFVARVYTVGGKLDSAIEWTRQSINNAVDPDIRQMLEKRLDDLEREGVLQRIEKEAREFKKITGHQPTEGQIEIPSGFWIDAQGVAHAPLASERMQLYKQADAP